MENFNQLLKYMEEVPFSIELINYCKDEFQIESWADEEFNEFSKIFSLKAKKECPCLSDEKIDYILKTIYHAGALNFENIYFIDGAAFRVYGERNIWNYTYKKACRIRLVEGSKNYEYIDFLDTTFFFSINNKELEGMDRSILPKLRDEISNIFVSYYKIDRFPEILGGNSGACYYYAIKCNKEKVINGLNNKIPFSLSIMSGVEGEDKVVKLDIECDLNKDRYLTIVNVDSNYEKLDDIINNNYNNSVKEKVQKIQWK